MRGLIVVTFIALLVAGALSEDAMAKCKFETSNHKYKYDVSSLVGKGPDEKGYYVAYDEYKQPLVYNLCGGVKEMGYCDAHSAACQKTTLGEWLMLGQLSSGYLTELSATEGGPSKGFKVLYISGTEGVACQTSDNKRAFTVSFLCDETAKKPVLSQYQEYDSCHYTMTFTSAAACPVKDKKTPSISPVAVVFIVCGILMCVGGAAGTVWMASKRRAKNPTTQNDYFAVNSNANWQAASGPQAAMAPPPQVAQAPQDPQTDGSYAPPAAIVIAPPTGEPVDEKPVVE